MPELTIDLGRAAYDVIIQPGLTDNLKDRLLPAAPGKKLFVITDSNVGKLHYERIETALSASDYVITRIVVEPGERSKRFETVIELCTILYQSGAERNSTILTLGGGVVGDLGGFAAAIYLRGIPFIQMPTTLLACCDSSVGGKTGINFEETKNLVGSFYQPRAVFIDPLLLETLPQREMVSGLAEAAKTGLIGDPELFALCTGRCDDIISHADPKITATVIEKSVAVKAGVVAQDERESGLRRILNFGHTIGHGIEAAASGSILHGEAVLAGMAGAVYISRMKGLLDEQPFTSVIDALIRIPASFSVKRLAFGDVLSFIRKDKKIIDNRVNFVLLKSAGTPVVRDDVSDTDIEEAWPFIQNLY